MTLKELNERTRKIKQGYESLRKSRGENVWLTSDYAQGLVGDVGDLMKLVSERRRKGGSKKLDRAIAKELSDCFYMIVAMSQELNIDLVKEYEINLEFLEQQLKELKDEN